MNVSSRNILTGLALASVMTIAGASAAMGDGCNNGCGVPAPTTPLPSLPVPSIPGAVPTIIPGVTTGGGNGPDCCNHRPGTLDVSVPGVTLGGPNIVVGGPTVSVGGGTIVQGGSTLQTGSFLHRQAQQAVVGRSGGGYMVNEATPSSQINLVGAPEHYTETVTENVPVTEEYCVDEISRAMSLRPVQAVCLDDKGTPHPASQVSGERHVKASYRGEVYRCMAGTHMQVTFGQFNNNVPDFSQAETISCRKGEALVYGTGGQLTCKPQIPQRNCNERSLLRRNGPGIKLIEMMSEAKVCRPEQRTVYKQVTREVERVREAAPMPMQLNGGVGNGVF